jgi:hypothetical protein
MGGKKGCEESKCPTFSPEKGNSSLELIITNWIDGKGIGNQKGFDFLIECFGIRNRI